MKTGPCETEKKKINVLRNILLSLMYAIFLPTILNLINSKSSKDEFKIDSTYILKSAIVFVASTAACTLIDYLWRNCLFFFQLYFLYILAFIKKGGNRMDYVILGLECLIFMWVLVWIYTEQVLKIYTILQLERNKNTVRNLQWEIFVFMACSAVQFYVLQRLLYSPVLFPIQS